jgi:hypothetical protein
MTITRENLAEHFGSLSDGELVAQLQSGELTELAREVAAAEMRSRNLDVPSDPAPPAGPLAAPEGGDASASGSEDMVLLARFDDPSSAYLLQSRLEGEGIPSMVADALAYLNTFGLAIGGVRVLVPQSYLAQGAELKRRIDRGDFRLDDKAEVE